LQNVAGSRERQATNRYNTQAQLLGTGLQTGGTIAGAYANRPATPTAPRDPYSTNVSYGA